ncbi:hypothetical protein ABEB22_15170 (plasmid) [Thioclava sp. 'Guangxiensis']|uniref:hypothetical protein n=1 Tax=Thioclava sp. 'Guangxiensis' TaxID=3149044 RepID=UPI0032C43A84
MPKVKNTGSSDLTLPSGHVLPAGKETELPQAVLDLIDNRNVLGGRIRSGAIIIAAETKPAATPEKKG